MSTQFFLYFILPAILGVIILVMGGVFLFIDFRRKKERAEVETESWKTTGGKILSSEIRKHEAQTDDDKGTHIDINFEPVVEYAYTVKDAEYTSTKMFPGENIYFSHSTAEQIVNDHPVNKYVPVRYNPDDPSQSMLENRPEGTNYIQVAGLVLASFGVLACCFTGFMMFLLTGSYK